MPNLFQSPFLPFLLPISVLLSAPLFVLLSPDPHKHRVFYLNVTRWRYWLTVIASELSHTTVVLCHYYLWARFWGALAWLFLMHMGIKCRQWPMVQPLEIYKKKIFLSFDGA
jgi:hypothetical protein